MFLKDTLFILGAGASVPYGFPVGEDLLSHIIEVIETHSILIEIDLNDVSKLNTSHGSDIKDYNLSSYVKIMDGTIRYLFQNYIEHNIPVVNLNGRFFKKIKIKNIAEFSELQKTIIENSPVSIDSFLNQNPRFAAAGKSMIIYTLLMLEKKDAFTRSVPDNWYSNLLNEFFQGCKNASDIVNNKLKIITFNYDVSLDYCLMRKMFRTGLINDCNNAKEFIATFIKNNIFHVYGKIHSDDEFSSYGEYASRVDSSLASNDFYLNTIRLLKSVRSCEKIRLIAQERKETPEYKRLILEAKKIISIGFSFNRDNLSMLGFPEDLTGHLRLFENREFYYTDYNGTLNALDTNFKRLKYENPNLVIIRSVSGSISSSYENDFKKYLF